MDLTTLEYPRHLHKTHAEFLVVWSADEAAAALAQGWTVECPPPVYDAPAIAMATVTADVPALVEDVPIVPSPAPAPVSEAPRPKTRRTKAG